MVFRIIIDFLLFQSGKQSLVLQFLSRTVGKDVSRSNQRGIFGGKTRDENLNRFRWTATPKIEVAVVMAIDRSKRIRQYSSPEIKYSGAMSGPLIW